MIIRPWLFVPSNRWIVTRTSRSLRSGTGQPLCQEEPTIRSRTRGGIRVTEEWNAACALPPRAARASAEAAAASAFIASVLAGARKGGQYPGRVSSIDVSGLKKSYGVRE